MALTDRLGIPRTPGVHALLLAIVIAAVGNGLFSAFALLYFNRVAGLPLSQVGIALTAAALVGLLANPIAGSLVDRIGARGMLIVSFGLQGAGYLGFLAVHSIPVLFVMATLELIGLRTFWVAFPAMVANISAGGERDRWYALTGAAQSAGLGVGGLIAGSLVAVGGETAYRALLLGNGSASLIAGIVIALRVPATEHERMASTESGGYRSVAADRPYLLTMGACVVFALCVTMIVYALPVYAVEVLGVSSWIVGALFALNTVLLTLQPLLIRRLAPYRRTRVLVSAGVVWLGASVLFLIALRLPANLIVPYLFFAVAFYTLGEALFSPVSSALAAAAGPEELRGRYIAMLSLAWGVAGTIAPAFFTGFFALDDAAPWIAVAALVIVAMGLVLKAEPGLPETAVWVAPGSEPAEAHGVRLAET